VAIIFDGASGTNCHPSNFSQRLALNVLGQKLTVHQLRKVNFFGCYVKLSVPLYTPATQANQKYAILPLYFLLNFWFSLKKKERENVWSFLQTSR